MLSKGDDVMNLLAKCVLLGFAATVAAASAATASAQSGAPPTASVAAAHEAPTMWQLCRWYVPAAVAVVLLQGALIAGLLVTRARQRRAEAQALRERDDLAHVLRVTTLNELTSSLAHEISQPLGSIMLNAEAAMRFMQSGRKGDTRDVQEALGDIIASADHASHVIGRVRTLFRKAHLEPVSVDVKVLVDDVVRLLHAAMLTEHIDIRVALADVVPAVLGDPVQLEQVLLNVVRNACDAIGARKDGPRSITIQTHQGRPGHVAIEIADAGIGANDDVLGSMFDKFTTTKPKGLGMGLAISRSIIEAHGGLIWATRNAGRGLTMHIELVAYNGETCSPARAGMRSLRGA